DTNGCSSSTSALVEVNPGSVGGSINGGGTIYEGISTVNLQLIGYSGNILYWQKQFNQGEWTTIPLTSSNIPETDNGVGHGI
ncbi:MAG: hypothetical protein IPH88_18120, partial [Bacteroidales bacterium]|nr:hypothetical protein [Bacteroidales bacterium]